MKLNITVDHFDVVIEYPTRDAEVLSHEEAYQLSNELPEPYASEFRKVARVAETRYNMTRRYPWD